MQRDDGRESIDDGEYALTFHVDGEAAPAHASIGARIHQRAFLIGRRERPLVAQRSQALSTLRTIPEREAPHVRTR